VQRCQRVHPGQCAGEVDGGTDGVGGDGPAHQFQFRRIDSLAMHDEPTRARGPYAEHVGRPIVQDGELVQLGGGVVSGNQGFQPQGQPRGLDPQAG
jgi:hypothetical protein